MRGWIGVVCRANGEVAGAGAVPKRINENSVA